MSNFFAKIVAFFSAIIVTITGWFSFADKKDQKPDDSKPTTTVSQKVTTKKTTTTTTQNPRIDEEFLKDCATAINALRKKQGVANIKSDANLTKAAAVRSKELATKFDHTRPNGKKYTSVFDDLKLTKPSSSAENIASATKFTDAADIISNWEASSQHKQNMCNEKYTKFGIAWYKAGGKEYVCLILGA